MIISTFNIQNNSREYNIKKSKNIYDYIKKNKIDIIGLQEVFYKCNDDLEKLLYSKYNIVGKFRYFFKILFPIKNERNPIITKYNIINNKTYHLPSFKAKYNRIITKACIKYKNKYISVYNTHIEVNNDDIKKKQLIKIYNILKKDNNPIILMGDFNLTKNNKLLNNFINLLQNIGINHIEINTNTYRFSNNSNAIDHIFVSNHFNVISKNVDSSIKISDHYPVIIKIDLKNEL